MQLNSHAEAFIKRMGYSQENSQQLRTCISNYSVPQSKEALVQYIIYRAFNTLKACFGQSDWQLTKNKLHQELCSVLKKRNVIDLTDSNEPLIQRWKISLSMRLFAGTVMKTALNLNGLVSLLSAEDRNRLVDADAVPSVGDTMAELSAQKELSTHRARMIAQQASRV
jgi:hypothetical protein